MEEKPKRGDWGLMKDTGKKEKKREKNCKIAKKNGGRQCHK
jgi:hypothetical protein